MEMWERDLRSEDLFHEAMDVFTEIQIVGAELQTATDEIKIETLLEKHTPWMRFDGQTHQKIGALIANHFPEFAALCREPVHIVYDYTDSNNHGIYRRV